jgi:hypothetical protein
MLQCIEMVSYKQVIFSTEREKARRVESERED